jgi:plastocyanin
MGFRRSSVAVGLAVVALALAGCGGGDDEASGTTDTDTGAETGAIVDVGTPLTASVGPGFDISFTSPDGPVTRLAPGTYTITVDDQSDIHNFHLTGPGGVDEDSGVSETGTSTWEVTFSTEGSYQYQCDPHASQMNGDFEVTTG